MAPVGSKNAPEAKAREKIDRQLEQAGWVIQDVEDLNRNAAVGVAAREFRLAKGHGFVDYMLFVDGEAVGVLEAKPAGHTLGGVEAQIDKYTSGLPATLNPPIRPLPFAYLSTGEETRFVNRLDPHPRSRDIFNFHQPETLREWLAADTLDAWLRSSGGFYTKADDKRPSTLRSRLSAMPPVELPNLWPNKLEAIKRLENSLRLDHPRALIQMATGSGKTLLAVTALYRLIKFGGARRVLFLVDRANLGEQAEKEFQGFRTPDDNRKLTELYNVQRLTSNTIGASSKVVISTVQRLYSILKGEELDPDAEEHSSFDEDAPFAKEPLPVVYSRAIPPEYFDVIVVDECHRSIYSLWLQVLEYFDAHLIGLTATPSKHTYGFFNGNVVMEYPHEKAVADGVNCDFEVYTIRTRITAEGSTIEAGKAPQVRYRDRQTRRLRWERPDEDITYAASDLDRDVVAKDQIRLVVRTFRDRVLKERFPDRTEVPKTLIFAKSDSHAEDIVAVVREEFGQGNDFCQKITYKVTGRKPADLIQDFRISYWPRVAVTVDLIATGTDIKPVEIVVFMRAVKSRILFEQMKGRGVRVIEPDVLRSVTKDAKAKTHFVIVDCVGITESELTDTRPLETKPTTSLKTLLEHVAAGGTHPDVLSSLASRLARLDKQSQPADRERVMEVSGGATLATLSTALLGALDPDAQAQAARESFGLPPDAEPAPEQLRKAASQLGRAATAPLADNPTLRKLVLELKQKFEQVIDEVSIDELIELQTGISPEAREKAGTLVKSFEAYLAEHKDEIAALQFLYSVPRKRRLAFDEIKALAAAISSPPRSWTPEKLWRAYQTLDQSKVRGASAERLLTDVVSLVRFALHEDDALVPHGDRVRARFEAWLAQQDNRGKKFTPEQVRWLEMMRDHIATSLQIETDDFELTPFRQEGGLAKATKVFAGELGDVVRELNEVLAA